MESFAGQEVIFYSPNFHRHVVAELKGGGSGYSAILGSFYFLDEAEEKYPDAKRVSTRYSTKLQTIAGLGLEEPDDYLKGCVGDGEELLPPALVSMEAESVQDIIDSLSERLRKPFLEFFPEEDYELLYERIHFLLAPTSERDAELVDIPKAFSEGYGAGLSRSQLVSAIIVLPHLLSIEPAAALNDKPNMSYFVMALKITVDQLNVARNRLSYWLDGECAQDSATFAHLHSLGVSWEQCGLILRAFSTSLVSVELERTFGPEPLSLSCESIDFLRARFQLSPPEILYMMKSHSKLSTYSVDVLKSHTRALQSSLGLSSPILKDLVLQRPSLLGVSTAKVSLHVNFFRNKCKFVSWRKWFFLCLFRSNIERSETVAAPNRKVDATGPICTGIQPREKPGPQG